MDLHGYSHGEHGRFEQILNQFLLKSLHIILDSRVPANRPSSRYGETKKSDKWFNLALGDRPTAMDSLSFWGRTVMEPIVIDIILVQESQDHSSDRPTSGVFNETVLERWIVEYDNHRSVAPQVSDASYRKTYKKSIILLRSVYSMLRLLPAFKAFRKLRSVKQNSDFDINYKICSFSSPFSRTEEELMKKYNFVPVEAQQGCLSVSVSYREDLSEFNLDSFVSCPPEIISDYVGSPLTDPMRSFPSSSYDRASSPSSFLVRGKKVASPFQRPHSWTSGLHRELSSQQNQLFSGSPPLYKSPYENSPSPTDTYVHGNQIQRSAPTHHKASSEDLLSPPFSSSPSPSPPTYFSSCVQSRLRPETAPMSIPHSMMGRSPRHLSLNFSDPNRHSLPPLSPRNTKYGTSSHESSSGSRSMRRHDSLKSGELSSGPITVGQKVSQDTKEDSGRFSSLLSSSSSPRVGFSRSSSRLSFQDDFGDSDFSCPFIVDDVDPPESQRGVSIDGRNSSEVCCSSSSSQLGARRSSQDAAVGALVHMLRTAPPLHQDHHHHHNHHYDYHAAEHDNIPESGGAAASEFFKPQRRASEALEELKAYQEMKDMLLSKSSLSAAPMTQKGKN